MPFEWWLRPVSRHARVGEHSAVVWKFASRTPPAASRSMFGVVDVGAVAAELRVADVVEHDEQRRSARPSGAVGSGGHHGVDSRQVGPITPPNSGSRIARSMPDAPLVRVAVGTIRPICTSACAGR